MKSKEEVSSCKRRQLLSRSEESRITSSHSLLSAHVGEDDDSDFSEQMYDDVVSSLQPEKALIDSVVSLEDVVRELTLVFLQLISSLAA